MNGRARLPPSLMRETGCGSARASPFRIRPILLASGTARVIASICVAMCQIRGSGFLTNLLPSRQFAMPCASRGVAFLRP